jgi:serine protease Do
MVVDIIEYGYVTGKASFGITLFTANLSQYNAVAGAYIYAVEQGSCAAQAGIQAGDIIVSFEGSDIKTAAELFAQKKNYRAGDHVELVVYRSGANLSFTLILDEERPEDRKTSSDTDPVSPFPSYPFGDRSE